MIEIELKNVGKYFGSNLVLKDISFNIEQGERVGIVGKNGSGKSTIFSIISKEENLYSGEVFIKKGAKIGYLEQIPTYSSCKVDDVLNSAFNHLEKIEKELRLLEEEMTKYDNLDKVLKKYSLLQEKYESLGGYEIEIQKSKVCEGLGISDDFRNMEFEFLSGGEKTITMLAKILMEKPDILLLDEPTNHLDLGAIEWLEKYLKEYSGTVVLISHDRYFLDSVVTKIVEIENLESFVYSGNYSKYLKTKEENLEIAVHNYKNQQKQIHKMEESIKNLRIFSRDGQNEKFVKRANSMQKRLDKMDKLERPNTKKDNMKLSINTGSRSSGDLVIMKNGSKSFDDKTILKDACFFLTYQERVALIGKNGCGKSTFINILLGEESLDSGEIKVADNKALGYLSQNIEFKNKDMTVLEFFRDGITISEGESRQYLAKYKFTKESVFKKVGNLSGGEKVRLILSKMLFNDINFIILDEPTNHLDIESVEVLEKALLEFKGTMLFISHDRYFINKIAQKVVELRDYKFYEYLGDYDYYREKRQKERKTNEVTDKVNYEKDSDLNEIKSKDKKVNRVIDMDKIESKINLLEDEIKEIDIKLSSLGDDYEEINKLYNIRENLNRELEELINIWIGD